MALNSQLGWILSGPVAMKESKQHATLVTHVLRVDSVTDNKCLERELRLFWEIESLGIIEDECLVQTQFEDNVAFEHGRYVVSLPWRETCIALPDNYNLSMRRLNNLFKRLKRTPDLLKRYDAVIKEQVESGIVVPVDNSESCGNHIHYIPHHSVLRQDKATTKLRVVYDASAKSDGLSLNDCLFIGPSLNKKIFDILLRFRMYPIIIIADIEKAFLMVRVNESDQDVLRFLWFKDVNVEKPELQIYKFTRVVFGVAPSPYLLNATIAQHLQQFEDTHVNTVKKIRESIYVDDVLMGANDMHEAFTLYQESKHIFSTGGFNLRKFARNCAKVQSLIDTAECSASVSETSTETYAQRTLGGGSRITQEGSAEGVRSTLELRFR